MTFDVVVFGGTTEGRELAEFCGRAGKSALVCVATPLGEPASSTTPALEYRVGRLGRAEVASLLRDAAPRLVIDATHPYATEVTANVVAAAQELGLKRVRVARSGIDSCRVVPPQPIASRFAGDPGNEPVAVPFGTASGGRVHPTSSVADLRRFPDLDALVAWLNTTEGVIFAATGAKEVRALTGVNHYAERVYLRLLPVAESIAQCIELGYPTAHLIAVQGPFSAELNAAMFRHVGASILVTKDSGDVGGVAAKLRAARACGMRVAMLDRPLEGEGVSVAEACRMIGKLGE